MKPPRISSEAMTFGGLQLTTVVRAWALIVGPETFCLQDLKGQCNHVNFLVYHETDM